MPASRADDRRWLVGYLSVFSVSVCVAPCQFWGCVCPLAGPKLQRLQLQVQKRTQSAKPRAGGMAAVSVPVATLASVDIGEVFGAADDPEEHSRSAAANSTPSLFRPDLEVGSISLAGGPLCHSGLFCLCIRLFQVA